MTRIQFDATCERGQSMLRLTPQAQQEVIRKIAMKVVGIFGNEPMTIVEVTV